MSRSVTPAACATVALVLLALGAGLGAASAQADAWALLREPGYAVFMRHAEAPGYGDPPGYRLDACETQRNLNEHGRAQARRTSEALARHGVVFDRVLTSEWCRCRETARLVAGREAEPMPALNNLVDRREHTTEQVGALKAFLASLDGRSRVLLVTHNVVISALTGIGTASGEMVIVRLGQNGEPAVAGRLRVD